MQRVPRNRLTCTLLLVASCASAPELTKDRDPFAGRKFPPLDAATLRQGELPEGYRLGDPGLAADADGKRPWRWSRDPNAETFGVVARCQGPRIDHVQWIYPNRAVVTTALLDEAGIELREPIGAGRARNRDWGRLTQSHAANERTPVTLYATNRPGLYVQLRDYNRAIDSLVWCQQQPRLWDYDELKSLGDPIDSLREALAAKTWPEVELWQTRLQHLKADQVRALLAEAETAISTHRNATNAPLLAELAALEATHTVAWATANSGQRVQLYVEHARRAAALTQKLLRASSPVPGTIRRLWLEQVSTEGKHYDKSNPTTGTGWFWRWAAANPPLGPQQLAEAWQAVQKLDAESTVYLDALAARMLLQKTKPPVLPPEGEPDRAARQILAKIARRQATIQRTGKQLIAAAWLEQVLAHDLETLLVPSGTAFPYVTEQDWKAWFEPVAAYESLSRGGNTDARIRHLHGLLQQEASYSTQRAQRTKVAFLSHTRFLNSQVENLAQELDQLARTTAKRGLPATACQIALQAAACRRRPVAAIANLPHLAGAAAPQHSGALAAQLALPLLAEVLPPIDPNTAQADRLCELLTEGKAASWPLVKELAISISPGDVPTIRQTLAMPAQYAHLQRVDGQDSVRLIAMDQPSNPTQDERFWQKYTGWSKETYTEGAWIRGEAAWIKQEKEATDQERIEVDAITNRLNAEARALNSRVEQHEASRSKVNSSDQASVNAFNRKVTEHKQQQAALKQSIEANKPLSDAFRSRVTALNKRIDEYNRRLSALNERRMREGAAGQNQLDAMLWPPLHAAVQQRLEAWIEATLARLPAGAQRDREVAAARWLFGQPGSGPALYGMQPGNGYAQLMAAAAHRLARRQSSNEAYAAKVAEYCHWATLGQVADRDATFRSHAIEFTKFREPKILRAALESEQRLSATVRKQFLSIMEAVRVEVFGK